MSSDRSAKISGVQKLSDLLLGPSMFVLAPYQGAKYAKWR